MAHTKIKEYYRANQIEVLEKSIIKLLQLI